MGPVAIIEPKAKAEDYDTLGGGAPAAESQAEPWPRAGGTDVATNDGDPNQAFITILASLGALITLAASVIGFLKETWKENWIVGVAVVYLAAAAIALPVCLSVLSRRSRNQ
jgi:hypothetical protein